MELRSDQDSVGGVDDNNIQGTEATIGALGSGSDYTPFLQHLGVPSLDMGFGGDYGVYHSAFDSFYWMSHFGDPEFVYHVAAAQLWGTIAMRLADAASLPLNYSDYAAQVREYFNDNVKVAKRRNLTGFDEKGMSDALDNFTKEAAAVERDKREALAELERIPAGATDRSTRADARLRKLNDALVAAERALTDNEGLRSRPWYKHQIYAPGFYTGYAALPLPDFRQALDDRNTVAARESLDRIVRALNRATETLRRR